MRRERIGSDANHSNRENRRFEKKPQVQVRFLCGYSTFLLCTGVENP